MIDLSSDTLCKIIRNEKLVLKEEDQLLRFINHLYSQNKNLYYLYESVQFINASTESLSEFINIFDINDITSEIWQNLSNRLIQKVEGIKNESNNRYNASKEDFNQIISIQSKPFLNFSYLEREKDFNGIINYLRKKSNNIESEINFSASSFNGPENYYKPSFVSLFENQNKRFFSGDLPNSWFCLDFKERRVIPTNYTLKSYDYDAGGCHPKSWVIEVSNDNSKWDIIDEQKNCSYLNGNGLIHTFDISKENQKEFKYIRMRQTNKSWYNDNRFAIDSFEIYGKLI